VKAIASAPGKIVLSGAYVVLEGAPALVTAVDRYAIADASRPADFVTPEVREALRARGEPDSAAPWIDASALRSEDDRKLGLGSSAAILVASLAALELRHAPELDDESLARRVLRPALEAHRRAQGGGSGIDVIASTLGGTQRCVLVNGEPQPTSVSLPEGIFIEVWASARSASTATMLRHVAAFRDRSPDEHRALFSKLHEAAEHAASATSSGAFIEALRRQAELLARLGRAASAPIVTDDLEKLDTLARRDGGVMLPSGAGGGDVVLFVGPAPSGDELQRAARHEGYDRLSLRLGARGVHAAAPAGKLL